MAYETVYIAQVYDFERVSKTMAGIKSRGRTPAELRDEILAAFWTLGGRRWLVRAARRSPGLVLPLFARLIPSETKHTVEAHYATTVAIRVEDREAIPGEAIPALPAPALATDDASDDWLASPVPIPIVSPVIREER